MSASARFEFEIRYCAKARPNNDKRWRSGFLDDKRVRFKLIASFWPEDLRKLTDQIVWPAEIIKINISLLTKKLS